MTILFIIPMSNGPVSLVTKDLIKFVIFAQYIPRLLRIFPLYREVTRTSGIFTETPWAGAAFNLLIYMLGSHVSLITVFYDYKVHAPKLYICLYNINCLFFQIIGSFWYLFAIEREDDCWRNACNKNNNCDAKYLYCDEKREGDYSWLNTSCIMLQPDQIKNSSDFDFGIFLDAFESHIVETKDFPQKFLYCFWWGLRSLRFVCFFVHW